MQKIKTKKQWIAGVDEAGRGPLAGPVAVGVAVIPADFDWMLLPGVGDSKKLSAKRRDEVFRRARALKRAKIIDFRVALVSERMIDRINIARAVEMGIDRCFARLALDPACTAVKLDGLLTAPCEYSMQETIIHGDAVEPVIGLASILAKVTRDAHMVRLSRTFPAYAFDIHKGYGTAAHRASIAAHGLSSAHRMTFCKRYC